MSHIVLRTGDGILLATLQNVKTWRFARTSNDVGWFSLQCADLDERLLAVDRILEFYRTPRGAGPVLLGVGFLRSWEWADDRQGGVNLELQGPDQVDLLRRRVVAYTDPEANWNKTGYADDLIKAVVRENMGPLSTDPWYNRGRAYDASLFNIAADTSEGKSVTRTFQFRNTLEVIQDLADASTWPSPDNDWEGQAIFFDCEYVGPAKFEFRTYSPLRGVDRTIGNNTAPIIFSKEAGNLADPALRFDYTDEMNIIYGLGQGDGEDRMVDPENDQVRGRLSPWNVHEDIVPATEEDTVQGISYHAYDKMQKLRPQVVFSGKLVDTPWTRFGVDWGFGDLVTVRFRGMEFDGRVDSFTVLVTDDGRETVEATVSISKALEGRPT